jgi:hypothetical protein
MDATVITITIIIPGTTGITGITATIVIAGKTEIRALGFALPMKAGKVPAC